MSSGRESRGVPGIMVIAGLIAAFNLGYSTGVQVGEQKAVKTGVSVRVEDGVQRKVKE